MDKLYLATRIIIFAIEIGAIAAAVSGIINAKATTLFAGILLFITMRVLDERQMDKRIKEDVMDKINMGAEKESGDENLWILFQLLLVVAIIVLATL